MSKLARTPVEESFETTNGEYRVHLMDQEGDPCAICKTCYRIYKLSTMRGDVCDWCHYRAFKGVK